MPLPPCRADGGAGVTEIVGLSCAYPGAAAADSVSGFWGAAVAGTDLPTDIPYDRWAIERHYSPDVTGGLALPGFVEHVLPWLLWLAGGSFLGGDALNTHTPQLQPFNIQPSDPCVRCSPPLPSPCLQWRRCMSVSPASSQGWTPLMPPCSGGRFYAMPH